MKSYEAKSVDLDNDRFNRNQALFTYGTILLGFNCDLCYQAPNGGATVVPVFSDLTFNNIRDGNNVDEITQALKSE